MLFILLILLTTTKPTRQQCEELKPPKYYLIEKCHRSTLGVIARANYTSLTSCQKLALGKKGLAFNFSPPEVRNYVKKGDEPVQFTCEVLKCAEADGGTSLVNDTRYDYHSLYAKHLPHINSTCVPGIGMIRLLDKQNYSSAESECKNMSGVLVDILSEAKTDAVAQMMIGVEGVDVAYVGVRRTNVTDFVNVYGDTLDCTTFRAWSPGHPKRKQGYYDCVAITRSRTWKTFACKTKLPALCELLPSGPYKKGSIFASEANSTVRVN